MEKGCPSCGRAIDVNLEKCPYCNFDFNDLTKIYKHYSEQKEIQVSKYAGFIKRMAANSIDYVFMMTFFVVMEAAYLFVMMPDLIGNFNINALTIDQLINMAIPFFVTLFLYLIYCSVMQSSRHSATLGEALVGIKVIDEVGSRLTFGLALKRNILRILNVITLGFGLLMIIFTKKRQALSDIASRTFVINSETTEEYRGLKFANLFKRFCAFVIDIIFIIVIYFVLDIVIENVVAFYPEYAADLNNFLPLLKYLILFIYFPQLDARHRTLGKKIMKTQLRRVNGEKLGYFKSYSLFLCLFVELIIFPFGVLLAFVTPKKQTFKELVTDIVTVDY